MSHPDTDLVVGRVGGLVAEQDEVEFRARSALGTDGLDDGFGRGARVPLPSIGLEKHRPVDAHGHGIAELLKGGLRTER